MSKTPLQARQLSQLPARNLIINGNFDFWQRGTSLTAGSLTYLADRWMSHKSGTSATVTSERSTDVPNNKSTYSLKMTVTSAGAITATSDNVQFIQRIEGYNILPFVDNKFSLSFWIKSNLTGTYTVRLLSSAGAVYGIPFTIDSSNTWEKKTFIIEAPNTDLGTWNFGTGTGIQVGIILAAGSDFTESVFNSWLANTGGVSPNQVNFISGLNSINIAQVSFTPVGTGAFDSSVEIPFARIGKSIQEELSMCQRYYWKLGYGSSAFEGSSSMWFGSGVVNGSTSGGIILAFPVRMRSDPTLSTSGLAGLNYISNNTATALTGLNTSLGLSVDHAVIQCITAATQTGGQTCRLTKNSPTSFVAFDAEL